MKKILLFSRDPGAANCIIPIYHRLHELGRYELILSGRDFALSRYLDSGLIGREISPSVKDFLEREKPDLIVTGTGTTDLTDRFLWQEAGRQEIPTVAILDQWLNYRVRFTLNSPGTDASQSPLILPDKICVMDEFAKREMIKEGLPEERLVITGEPYFETVYQQWQRIDSSRIREIKRNLKITEVSPVMTFVSEPIVESYADPLFLGYTQLTILDQVLDGLNKALEKSINKPIVLIIRLHPRNNLDLLKRFLDQKSISSNLQLIIEREISSEELIAVSDLVVGLSSMLLLEAALLGKPYASLQIGLKKEDPFVLSRMGLSKTILSEKELMLLLDDFLIGKFKDQKVPKFKVIGNASERITNLIDSLIYG